MIRHISAQTLAMYREDELGGRKAARIKAHLAGCEVCAGTTAGLADVSRVLAEVQVPAMPEHLADRIMLALATESAARASLAGESALPSSPAESSTPAEPFGTSSSAHIPGRPDLPDRTRHQRRNWRPVFSPPVVLRTLAATAAVAVIAGGGYLLATGGETRAGSGSPSGASGARPEPSRVPGAGTAGASGSYAPPASEPVQYDQKGAKVTTIALHTDTNYTRRSLAGQVRRIVQSDAPEIAIPATPTSSPTVGPSFNGLKSSPAAPKPTSRQTGAPSLRIVPHLGGCLTALAAGRRVLLADIARYLGKPAMIVVLRSSKNVDFFAVAVVGLACSASSPHVLFRTKIRIG